MLRLSDDLQSMFINILEMVRAYNDPNIEKQILDKLELLQYSVNKTKRNSERYYYYYNLLRSYKSFDNERALLWFREHGEKTDIQSLKMIANYSQNTMRREAILELIERLV
jgi:hypothetical protein